MRRLGSVTQILNGATPSSSRPEYWAGDIVWVTPDDLGKLKGRYIDNSSRRITQEGYNACGTKLALLGASSYLHAPLSVIWASLRVAACANQGCRLLVPQAATASEFFYHMLVAARPSLEVLDQGSTFLELSRSKLGTFPITFTPPSPNKPPSSNTLTPRRPRSMPPSLPHAGQSNCYANTASGSSPT